MVLSDCPRLVSVLADALAVAPDVRGYSVWASAGRQCLDVAVSFGSAGARAEVPVELGRLDGDRLAAAILLLLRMLREEATPAPLTPAFSEN